MNDIEKIAQLLLEGHCCSEALIEMGLALRGEKNEQLAAASRGLCSGMHAGCNCGALTGGALLLAMFDPALASAVWIPELVAWFAEEYGERYGSLDCRDIAGERMEFKSERCTALITAVYERCRLFLQEAGEIED